jgi:hypothetical protein
MQHWSSGRCLLTLVIFLGCLSLGWGVLEQWIDQNQSDRFLNASLLAMSTADYSKSQPDVQIAEVKLEIIGDMIQDSQPELEERSKRLASITAVLLSPVPTTTPLPDLPSPFIPSATRTLLPTPTAIHPASATATKNIIPTTTRVLPTLTPKPTFTSTPSQVVTPSIIPTSSTSSPTPPARTPTPTQSALPTMTPTPSPSPSPSKTLLPTNTPKPKNTPKPTKTPRPTKTVKPTR